MAPAPFNFASPARIWACVVCFRASPAAMQALVDSLSPQVERIVLADNAAHESAALQRLAGERVIYLPMEANLGTGAAMNLAWRLALEAGADGVISFDQDSHPGAGMVAQLSRTLAAASDTSHLAAVGPSWRDARTGKSMRILLPLRWTRRHAMPAAGDVVEADHVITSGCLIPAQAWREVGPYNEALFLDYVDIEWCLRARSLGWRVAIDTGCVMAHSIGDRVFTMGGRSLMVHAPVRNYLLVRNHMLLWRLPGLAKSWLFSDLRQVMGKLAGSLVLMPARLARLKWIVRGVRDGWRGRGGPPP